MTNWQQIVALLITVMAAGYLLLRLRRQQADPQSGACGGCRGCEKRTGADASPAVPLVDLQTLTTSVQRDRSRG